MEDMAPELLEAIRRDFLELLKGEALEQATYAGAEEYAERVGSALAEAFHRHLSSAVLPDGRLYWNIADRAVRPLLEEDHRLVSAAAVEAQQALNTAAGLGLKAQAAPLDTERIDGLLKRLTAAEQYDDVAWVLDEPVKTFSRSVVDDTLRRNVEFQGKAGLSPRIIRRAESHCCEWCSRLEGVYTYPDVPGDVYRRHARCRCVVEYDPGSGKRRTLWKQGDAAQQRALERAREEQLKRYNALTAEEKQKRDAARLARQLGKGVNSEQQRRRIGSQGQEIIDKPTYHKLTRDFLRRGGIIIRGEDAVQHLRLQGAYASYMMGGDVAFIRDDATVSDVLEEMYHAEQDRKKMFSEYLDNEMLIRREIDAQKYLLSVAEKYKIPVEEAEVTRQNLAMYEVRLNQILREKGEFADEQ